MEEDWRDYATCVGLDPEMWFALPLARGRLAPKTLRALEICRGCPVRAECLADVLELASSMNYSVPGVWGGTIESDRRLMVKARPRREPTNYDVPRRRCTRCSKLKVLADFDGDLARCQACNELIRKWERARRAQRSA